MAIPSRETAPPLMRDTQRLLKLQAEAGIASNILSDIMVLDNADAAHVDRSDAVRLSHDYFSSISKTYRGKFLFMAFANVLGGKKSLSEVNRALEDPACKAIVINSNSSGKYPDSPEYKDFFALACDRDVPVFIHPPYRVIGHDILRQYHLLSIVGRPTDITLGVLRMIMGGVFDEFPKLKLVCAYAGGMLPMLGVRMDNQCDTPGHAAEAKYVSTLSNPPSYYVKHNLYLDTATMSKEAIMCAISVVGEERVIFGTDYPPGSLHPRHYVDTVKSLPISEQAKRGILGENSSRLLKMKPFESVIAI